MTKFLPTALILLASAHDCLAFAPAPRLVPVVGRKLLSTDRTPFSLSPAATHPTPSSILTRRLTVGNFALEGPVGDLVASLFSYGGNVPFLQALGLNIVLFSTFQSKLRTMLTPTGLAHAMALGTLLWTTLGWRGWTLCVVYLLLGQIVTKVRFADKEKRGLAEGRGGRRGPENVW
jgi:hypothetical protein